MASTPEVEAAFVTACAVIDKKLPGVVSAYDHRVCVNDREMLLRELESSVVALVIQRVTKVYSDLGWKVERKLDYREPSWLEFTEAVETTA